jgi:hypothetical protein
VPPISSTAEPIMVTPISVAPPASANTERHMIVVPASTKAQQKKSEDIPVNTLKRMLHPLCNLQPLSLKIFQQLRSTLLKTLVLKPM